MVPSVVTIAGLPGAQGYTGDGGPATQATLNKPQAVCTDSIGNIFITDTDNRRVRKIDTAGKISTLPLPLFAQDSGINGPIGITIDKNDKLYISNTWDGDGKIVTFTGIIGNIDPPSGFSRNYLNDPYSLWISNNKLYIANYRGYVEPAGSVYPGTVSVFNITSGLWESTIYDAGDASNFYLNFAYPRYVSVGPDGSIYIVRRTNDVTSPFNHCVRRYKNGEYTTFAGTSNVSGDSGDGGPATAAKLNTPSSVFPDAFGNVYICDTGNGRIRMVSPDGIIQTVVGGGSSYNEGGHPLQIQAAPVSMWFDAQGRMYFTDASSTVRRINSVYNPAWWDPLQYEKICKPCN
jgi:streptogramin lyase